MNNLKAQWPLLSRLTSIAGSVGGLIALPFTLRPFERWGWLGHVLLTASLVLLIIFVVLGYYAGQRRKIYDKANVRGIRDYMYSWIRHGGPVAIWTRDHSWVNDDQMRKLLMDKARQKELTICVPTLTDFCEELANAGADVLVHGLANPSVRFTITNWNKATFSVALARPDTHVHVIEEYRSDQPVAALAKDLVDLAKAQRDKVL